MNRPGPATIAGRERYRAERREIRHARLLSVLRDLEARRITVDAACAACVELQYVAERRGYRAGVRAGHRR